MEYTPRQRLEIDGAFYYIIGLSTIFIISAMLQYITLSSAGLKSILTNLIVNSFNLAIAIIIYIKKRRKLEVTILPWILGFTTITAPLAVRYNHAFVDGWTFAVRSINTSAVLITFVILLSFFYKPKLLKFFSVVAISNWLLFLYIAYLNGAELHLHSYINGQPVLTGLVVLREISLIISLCTVLALISQNLSDVIYYDNQSIKQYNQIVNQADAQNKISGVIKEKTDSLFQRIESQYIMLNDFNLNMESQSARFSEMSATMEEISGASEQIAIESVTQVEGNVKMETIIDEFKSIRVETKRNLDATYNNIQSVSDQSATANDHLMEVEKTVYAIKDQSNRIGQTVELIVDIADRINLLSLNASIEAARAGESGRGFAVVADEIGKLAFQTQESIKEINNVITSSSKSTVEGATVIQKTAQMMRNMISQMDQGANKIRTLQESLLIEDRFTQIIIDQMHYNITQAEKINTATDEQKIAVETSFTAIEEVINILHGMSSEAKDMARLSDEIFYDAVDIVAETKQIADESEVASDDDYDENHSEDDSEEEA
ncbi:MAG: methyl-accepting chemotaxis protein [Leptospirales bacterium]|nr:methyl-accepting chemotaxis protein [Leptospirales bacterium]